MITRFFSNWTETVAYMEHMKARGHSVKWSVDMRPNPRPYMVTAKTD